MVLSFESILDKYLDSISGTPGTELSRVPSAVSSSKMGDIGTPSTNEFPGELREWFPLVDKATGMPVGANAAVHLSILLGCAD